MIKSARLRLRGLGKGGKDRVVPLGERAKAWLGAYHDQVRPQLVSGRDPQALFLSRDGLALKPSALPFEPVFARDSR